jgi:hypothetical protein
MLEMLTGPAERANKPVRVAFLIQADEIERFSCMSFLLLAGSVERLLFRMGCFAILLFDEVLSKEVSELLHYL